MWGVPGLLPLDLDVEIHLLLGVEGSAPEQHLVCQDSQCPPVHREAVLLLSDNFWSDKVRSAAESLCEVVWRNVLFAHPKVGQLDVAGAGEHHVVKLEVPVDDTSAVEKQEGETDLGAVESGPLLAKLLFVDDVEEEISAIEVFHHKEKSLRGLEGAEQLQERDK